MENNEIPKKWWWAHDEWKKKAAAATVSTNKQDSESELVAIFFLHFSLVSVV